MEAFLSRLRRFCNFRGLRYFTWKKNIIAGVSLARIILGMSLIKGTIDDYAKDGGPGVA